MPNKVYKKNCPTFLQWTETSKKSMMLCQWELHAFLRTKSDAPTCPNFELFNKELLTVLTILTCRWRHLGEAMKWWWESIDFHLSSSKNYSNLTYVFLVKNHNKHESFHMSFGEWSVPLRCFQPGFSTLPTCSTPTTLAVFQIGPTWNSSSTFKHSWHSDHSTATFLCWHCEFHVSRLHFDILNLKQ